MGLCRISQPDAEFLCKAHKGPGNKFVNFLTQESFELPVYTLSANDLYIHDSRAYARGVGRLHLPHAPGVSPTIMNVQIAG